MSCEECKSRMFYMDKNGQGMKCGIDYLRMVRVIENYPTQPEWCPLDKIAELAKQKTCQCLDCMTDDMCQLKFRFERCENCTGKNCQIPTKECKYFIAINMDSLVRTMEYFFDIKKPKKEQKIQLKEALNSVVDFEGRCLTTSEKNNIIRFLI